MIVLLLCSDLIKILFCHIFIIHIASRKSSLNEYDKFKKKKKIIDLKKKNESEIVIFKMSQSKLYYYYISEKYFT